MITVDSNHQFERNSIKKSLRCWLRSSILESALGILISELLSPLIPGRGRRA